MKGYMFQQAQHDKYLNINHCLSEPIEESCKW